MTDADGKGTVGPLLVAGNFPLPAGTDSLGGGAIASMGSDNVFVSLLEYTVGSVGTPLFSYQGLPCPLDVSSFYSNTMMPPSPGKGAAHVFFTVQQRAFAVYAVAGSYDNKARLVPLINSFLAGVTIQPPA